MDCSRRISSPSFGNRTAHVEKYGHLYRIFPRQYDQRKLVHHDRLARREVCQLRNEKKNHNDFCYLRTVFYTIFISTENKTN